MKINGIPLHDLHLHTGLSPCSGDPSGTPELYAPIAAKNGVELIGIADHMWDARVKHPGEIGWYKTLTFERQLAHMSECERVQHGVKIIYGVEAELFSGVLGLHESSAALLDFVSVAHSHFHQGPHALPDGYRSHEGVAFYMMKTFDEMIAHPLTQITAHPFEPCILDVGEDLLKIYQLVGRDRFVKSLEKARDKGISIEINTSLNEPYGTEVYEKTYMWMWQLAKEVGCLFHFGTDAHTAGRFEERSRPEVYKEYIDRLGLKPENMHPLCFR